MSNPWDNDPIVTPASGATATASPWENDPIVMPAKAPPTLRPLPLTRPNLPTPQPVGPQSTLGNPEDVNRASPVQFGESLRQAGSDVANIGRAAAAQSRGLLAAAGENYVRNPELLQPEPPPNMLPVRVNPPIPYSEQQQQQAATELRQQQRQSQQAAQQATSAIENPAARFVAEQAIPLGVPGVLSALPGGQVPAAIAAGAISGLQSQQAARGSLEAQGVPDDQAYERSKAPGAIAGAAGAAATLIPGGESLGGFPKAAATGAALDTINQAAQHIATGGSASDIDWKQVAESAAFMAGLHGAGKLVQGALGGEAAPQAPEAPPVDSARAAARLSPTPEPTPLRAPDVPPEPSQEPAGINRPLIQKRLGIPDQEAARQAVLPNVPQPVRTLKDGTPIFKSIEDAKAWVENENKYAQMQGGQTWIARAGNVPHARPVGELIAEKRGQGPQPDSTIPNVETSSPQPIEAAAVPEVEKSARAIAPVQPEESSTPTLTRASRAGDIIHLSFDGTGPVPKPADLQEQIRAEGIRASVNQFHTNILSGAAGNVDYRIDVEGGEGNAQKLYQAMFGHDQSIVNPSRFEQRAPLDQRFEAARQAGLKHETGIEPPKGPGVAAPPLPAPAETASPQAGRGEINEPTSTAGTPAGVSNEQASTRQRATIPEPQEQTVTGTGREQPGRPGSVDRPQEVRGGEVQRPEPPQPVAVDATQQETRVGAPSSPGMERFIDSAWRRVERKQPIPPMGGLENTLRDARKAGELRSRDDVARIVQEHFGQSQGEVSRPAPPPGVPEAAEPNSSSQVEGNTPVTAAAEPGAGAETVPPAANPVKPAFSDKPPVEIKNPLLEQQKRRLSALKARQPKESPELAGITTRRQELEGQLRDLVARDLPDVRAESGLPDSHPQVLQAYRENRPGLLISAERARELAADLPADHPARMVLHNLEQLEENKRGTKFHTYNTNQLEDGARVVLSDKAKPVEVNHSAGRLEDDINVEIPPDGMTLVGKKVLPPKEPSPQFYEGEKLGQEKGVFGQDVVTSSGVGDQKPLFHQPVDVPRPEPEQIGSKEANRPENTGKLFNGDDPAGQVLGFGRGKRVAQAAGKAIANRPFVKEDVAPTALETLKSLAEAKRDLQSTFAPQTGGKEAGTMAGALREHGATLAQRSDRARAALEKASRFFEGRSDADNLKFIDGIEQGKSQSDPKLDLMAKQLRDLLDGRRQEVQALGKGKLEHFIQDYFPHIWKDPEKAAATFGQILGKRPLEGSKSFLKQRTLPTTADGIAKGLEPISYNPVDLTLLKVREMDRYILGQKTLNELKGKGQVQFVSVNQRSPEGWTKLDDKIATVYGPPTIPMKEYVDKAVYHGLLDVASDLGISHERLMKVPRRGAIGLSYQGGDKIQSQYASETSVIAHELGHQLDYKYDLWNNLLRRDSGKGFKAGRSELRNIADMTERGKTARSKEEKIAQVLEAYIHAPEKMEEVAPRVFKWLDAFVKSKPELQKLADIRPGIALEELHNEKAHGGLLVMGHYYAPDPAARVFNNYMSPGLRDKSGVFRAYLGMANVMNQFQLGVSLFHAGFTSYDAAVSKLALGIEQLSQGKPIQAAGSVARVPIAPIENIARGSKVLNEWYHPGSEGAEIAQLVDGLKAAGGRVRMDDFYRTTVAQNMRRAFKQGNYLGGVLRMPFAAVEKAAAPVLEWLVPRQKLGVFADLGRRELAKLPPNASRDDVRTALGKVWDSVDNRMGQVVYDNLFWKKWAKDMGMASVRSLGWNLGTLRELGGAAVDTAIQAKRLATLNRPEITHRMAYAIALPALTATLGGTIHYLMNGSAPETLKDWFFPRTGDTDDQGNPVRISLPTYMKDIYAYYRDPTGTLSHKFHPMINTIAEMLQNRDYYGTKIRNEDDPAVKQFKDVITHLAEQFEPFSVRGFRQMNDEGAGLGKRLLPFIGVTQAPKSLSDTPAQSLARQLSDEHPAAPRTAEEAQASRDRYALVRSIQKDPAQRSQLLREALKNKVIRRDQIGDIMKRSKESPLAFRIDHLGAEDAMKVWAVASDKERDAIRRMMVRKILDSKTMPVQQKREHLHEIRQQTTSAAN